MSQQEEKSNEMGIIVPILQTRKSGLRTKTFAMLQWQMAELGFIFIFILFYLQK